MSAQRAQGPNYPTATLSRLKMTLRTHPNASYLTFRFSKKGFFGQILTSGCQKKILVLGIHGEFGNLGLILFVAMVT